MSLTTQPRIKAWSATGNREVSQTYYTVRLTGVESDIYWSTRIDPDGVVRHMDSQEEEERYLSDVADELAFASSLQPGAVTDYGAGLGWFLKALPAGWRKHAVERCEYAKTRLNLLGFQVATDTRNLRAGAFDLVFCHHVIEHCRDPIAVIYEFHRLLKKHGWLILATPDFASPCAVRFGERYRMLHDETHISLFSNESMHRCLRDHGFTIRDVRYPFPTRYATAATMARWLDTSGVSPPWPGNWMTFYCQR